MERRSFRVCLTSILLFFGSRVTLDMSFCYPEGNFGRNQLLDGSISLSPLYPNLTIDLHVRIATSLHQSFPYALIQILEGFALGEHEHNPPRNVLLV